MEWNRDQINQMLMDNPKAVERAMLRLYELQTESEKQSSTTNLHNNVGFAGNAARNGSYYARWVQSGRNLSGIHLERARAIAIRHSRQLVEIANSKK